MATILWDARRWYCPDCHVLLKKAVWIQYGERFHRFKCAHPMLAGQVVVTTAKREHAVVPVGLLSAALARVRHDHAYPMEISSVDNPHHCPGCDLETGLRAAIIRSVTEDSP